MRDRLRKFINHTATEIGVGILIIIGISLTVLEVKLPDHCWHDYFGYAADFINAVFIVELTIRWYVERVRIRFFKAFWIDMIAVIPFSNLFRILRIVRLLRLIRLGIVLTRRTRKMAMILNKSLAENLLIVVMLIAVFLIGAIGMHLLNEPNIASFSDAVWFSLFTLMGGEPIMASDIQTPEGKLITIIVMLGGFTMFAIFTGVVSAIMIERLRHGMDAKDVELEELDGHYLICGWNRSAVTIIREIQANRATAHTPIVVVAQLEQEPELSVPGINRGLIFFVRDDFSSTEVLQRVRVKQAQRAIFLADKSKPRSDQDRDARTILGALTIEKMHASGQGQEGDNIYSCVELLRRDEQKMKVLAMAGVEDVVESAEYMGNLIAHSTRAYGLIQVLEELLTSTWGNEFMRKPVDTDLVGTSISEALRICKLRTQELILAVVPGGGLEPCRVNPAGDYRLTVQDELIVVAVPERRSSQDRSRKVQVASRPPAGPSAAPEGLTLDQVEGHFVICGWNRAAPKIVQQLRTNLQTRYVPIVVVSELEEEPSELRPDAADELTFYISGDYSSTDTLEEARVDHARTAILLADKSIERSDQDRDARTILTALTIEKLNPDIHSCAELLNRDTEKVRLLEMAHVEDIVMGDEYVGNLIAHATRTIGLVQVMDELLTSNIGNEVRKIEVPEGWVGKDYVDALCHCKEEKDALIMAIESHHGMDGKGAEEGFRYYLTNPPHDYRIREDDRLFVITTNFTDAEIQG